MQNPEIPNSTWLANTGTFQFTESSSLYSTKHPKEGICSFWKRVQNESGHYQPPTDSLSDFAPFLALLLFFFVIILFQLVLTLTWRYRISRMHRLQEVFGDENKHNGLAPRQSLDMSDLEAFTTIEDPEPLTVQCHKLSYTIKKNTILKDVTLKFTPGSMTAIMGPSGEDNFFSRMTRTYSSFNRRGENNVNVPSGASELRIYRSDTAWQAINN